MSQLRNENAICIKITKIYLPKYLLNSNRLLVICTSQIVFVFVQVIWKATNFSVKVKSSAFSYNFISV